MLATSTMMSEIKHSDPQPDLGYVECNHRWNSSILADACPQHKTVKMILQGEDHGDIYSRPTAGTLPTSGRLQFMEPLENFLATTGSKVHPLCKASDLWSASDSEQELELLELCKKRVVPVGVPAEELTWNDVLLPTQKSVEKCVCCIAGISQVKSRHCFQSVSYVIRECDCCISLTEQPSRPSSRYLFCARLADLATGQTSFASVLFCLVFCSHTQWMRFLLKFHNAPGTSPDPHHHAAEKTSTWPQHCGLGGRRSKDRRRASLGTPSRNRKICRRRLRCLVPSRPLPTLRSVGNGGDSHSSPRRNYRRRPRQQRQH